MTPLKRYRIFAMVIGVILVATATTPVFAAATVETTDSTATDESKTDSDGDGISDRREERMGWDSNDSDMDDDGLSDGEEVNEYLTNPEQADTDGDGINDGAEVQSGTDPTNPNEAETASDTPGTTLTTATKGGVRGSVLIVGVGIVLLGALALVWRLRH